MTVENTNCTGQLPCHQVGADQEETRARDNLAKIIARHMSYDALDAQGGWLNNHARCCALDAADEILQASPSSAGSEELLARAQAFVDRKYVARADARQQSMGLAYVAAERQDLAREIVRFVRSVYP